MPTAPPPPAPAALVMADAPSTQSRWIEPKAIWPDDEGHHVQAHGGDVIRVGDTFWWFGEERSRDNQRDHKYVGCYSSTDLVNWAHHKPVVDLPAPADVGGANARSWVLERPKVYHNARTGKFVMYAHVDDYRYGLARVGVFTSDTVDGDYTYLKSFRPLGQESRDIGQFVDDDGTAYLIFESRPTKGFFVAQLSDDYLDVAKQTAFIKAPLEGGAIARVGGTYYCVASYMSGWNPNNNQYATAKSLAGPWSRFQDIAPPKTKTYTSQSAFLLNVHGSRTDTVIFIGDEWRPKAQWDSRYLWMPLEIGDGKLRLPPPKPWTIDVQSGVVTFK